MMVIPLFLLLLVYANVPFAFHTGAVLTQLV